MFKTTGHIGHMPRPSTRDRILAAGRDVIHRHGFSASGVAEITAAAGVPKGSFYNHFPSKEAFACAVLEDYWEQGGPACVLLSGPEPALERVREHFKALDKFVAADSYAAGCMLGNFAIEASPHSETLRKHVASHYARWTSQLAACLDEGQKAGSISNAIPSETLAGFLIAAWHGAVQRAKVERNGRATAAFHRTLKVLLTPS
jgi:TetR/AcrR family transcriptional regulator, transcriptional repressor for nem operon